MSYELRSYCVVTGKTVGKHKQLSLVTGLNHCINMEWIWGFCSENSLFHNFCQQVAAVVIVLIRSSLSLSMGIAVLGIVF